ncbi:Myb-related protein A [Sugiyamaella lignohabitans]|uniref:Myb-related protein A n=1 Tax=Sugiyamaella lignohabitans TaxID=796027 RepID=A0A161HKE0_9ASCO|nr:Myb-related protein A [Sugiyamaella lignohabitans]ANB13437.1 Myb-related protein A [Sugiyamaella lignohabitans]
MSDQFSRPPNIKKEDEPPSTISPLDILYTTSPRSKLQNGDDSHDLFGGPLEIGHNANSSSSFSGSEAYRNSSFVFTTPNTSPKASMLFRMQSMEDSGYTYIVSSSLNSHLSSPSSCSMKPSMSRQNSVVFGSPILFSSPPSSKSLGSNSKLLDLVQQTASSPGTGCSDEFSYVQASAVESSRSSSLSSTSKMKRPQTSTSFDQSRSAINNCSNININNSDRVSSDGVGIDGGQKDKNSLHSKLSIKLEELASSDYEQAGSPDSTPEEEENEQDETYSEGSSRNAIKSSSSNRRNLKRARGEAFPSSRRIITKPTEFHRWTEQDDMLISYLKEEKEFSWRRIAEAIQGRHTWQAIQMRYLRSLKNRYAPFTEEEEGKLEEAILNDWRGRWKRVSFEMGPSFSEERVIRKCMENLGHGELLDADVSSDYTVVVTSQGTFHLPPNANKLSDKVIQFLQQHEVNEEHDIVLMYTTPCLDSEN